MQRELQSKDAIEKVFTSKEAFKKLTVLDKMVGNNMDKMGGKTILRLSSHHDFKK